MPMLLPHPLNLSDDGVLLQYDMCMARNIYSSSVVKDFGSCLEP